MASAKAQSFSAADEALYLERYRALAQSGSVGTGEAAYAPLEMVSGGEDHGVLVERAQPTLSAGVLAKARHYAAERNSSALIIWKDGAIESEDYFGDFTQESEIISKSLAKPLTALLVGRAIEQGHIESLDQPVADFITEWRDDPVRSRITIRHLLGMRSGLLPQALGGGPDDVLYRAYLHPRHDEIIINAYPLTDEPGSVYEYSNANAELIAPIIERATGMRYAEYVSHALLQPLGATGGSVWLNRSGGTAHSGCCMMLPARSWLGMAILVLQDGVWNGERLLPEGYVTEMRRPTPQNPHYGLGLWLAGPYKERRGYANPRIEEGRVFHSEPYLDKDLALFDGNSNQVAYIIPSQDMVILRTGGSPPPDREWDNAFLPNLLIRDALAQPGAVVPEAQAKKPVTNSCAARLAGESRLLTETIRTDEGRSIPVEIHLPAMPGTYPLIGFSHGALAAPDRYHRMLEPLAAAGYIIIAPMHLESEEFAHDVEPTPGQIWATRVEDMSLSLDPPPSVSKRIGQLGYFVENRRRVAMGHSFGALMAQLAGGAEGRYPDGEPIAFAVPDLAGTVAWSPPGVMPGTIEADGWTSLAGDALVLTGTKDVLTQMQKDWEWHLQGYAAIPPGHKTLWIGDGIDHYFGGNFGREKTPDKTSIILFERALSQTLSFLDDTMGRQPTCQPGPPVDGERIMRD